MLGLLLFLLGLGFVSGVLLSQRPSRDICRSGTSVTIQCHQIDRQDTFMFWYLQPLGQSLIMVATANQDSKATYESGFANDKYPISRPNLTFSIHSDWTAETRACAPGFAESLVTIRMLGEEGTFIPVFRESTAAAQHLEGVHKLLHLARRTKH